MMSFEMWLGDDEVTVEYNYIDGDESVGCKPDYEFWVYLEDKDITDDLTDKQSKEVFEACKEDYERPKLDYYD